MEKSWNCVFEFSVGTLLNQLSYWSCMETYFYGRAVARFEEILDIGIER